MRLFVAVNLPVAEKTRLGAVLNTLRRSPLPLRWVDEDSLHITLKFLGEVAEDFRADIAAAMRRAAQTVVPFDIVIEDFGTFPPRGRARVLWIGVKAPPTLESVQDQLERELEALGFPRENRDFHPHITLARANSRTRGAEPAEVDRIVRGVGYNAVVPVHSIDLMRSHLGSSGARYERIERIDLGSVG